MKGLIFNFLEQFIKEVSELIDNEIDFCEEENKKDDKK